MMPNNRDIVESIRRERAADMVDTQIDLEALVNLAPPCTWDRHDTGETGCEPGAPAEWVLRFRIHCGPPMPTIFLVCHAQQIRIWRTRNARYECDTCGELMCNADIVDFLGRVEEYYP